MNPLILEEAAEWLIELNSGEASSEARQQFDAWLRTSPEHVRAYLELLPAWEIGAALPLQPPAVHEPSASDSHSLTVDELIAMGKGAPPNVVHLNRPPERSTEALEKPGRVLRKPNTPALVLAASLLLACTLALAVYLKSQRGVYTTGIGEQRTLQLEDGSTLELDSRSKVRVRYDEHQRNVELLAGQALFSVAHNPERPFVVSSDHIQVRAVGTQFDVYRKDAATVVTVVEGRVAVLDPDPAPAPSNSSADISPSSQVTSPGVLLVAGQQLTVTPAAVPKPTTPNIANTIAWTQRRLVFEDSTLGEVVEEFNRYNTRQLVLKDPALGRFPITATFLTPDPETLVRFLRTQPDIDIQETRNQILIARK